MEEQKEMEKMNQTQQPPWLVNIILFFYEGKTCTGMTLERKQHIQQYKGNRSNNEEA